MPILQLGPHGTRRRGFLRRLLTRIEAIRREGPIRFAGRKTAQLARDRAEQARIKHFDRQPWLADTASPLLVVITLRVMIRHAERDDYFPG